MPPNMRALGRNKRQRLLSRLGKFASTPSLLRGESSINLSMAPLSTPEGVVLPALDTKELKSVSCTSLSEGSVEDRDMDVVTPLVSPLQTPVRECEEEEVFVECEEGPAMRGLERAGWGKLSTEMKLIVLGYLDPLERVRAATVSREWHALCFDGQLWADLSARDYYNRVPAERLTALIKWAGPYVRSLDLRGCEQLSEHWDLESFARACKNLRSADFEGTCLPTATVKAVVQRNPHLEHLNISAFYSKNAPKVRDDSLLPTVAASCRRLRTLDVSSNQHVTATTLLKIIERCPQLTVLKANNTCLRDVRLRDLRHKDRLFETLFARNTLRELYLGNCSIRDEQIVLMFEGRDPEIDILTDRAIVPPRKLTHLDLANCSHLTDLMLYTLSERVPDLTHLDLACIHRLTDMGFAALLPTVPHLRVLNLEQLPAITDRTLGLLAGSCTSLESLTLSYCENITDTGLVPLLRSCPRLRHLEIDNTKATDITLAEAARIVHDVRGPGAALSLVAFDCPNITWSGIREILLRNMEAADLVAESRAGLRRSAVNLHARYDWMPVVKEHAALLDQGRTGEAEALEREWVARMMRSEEREGRRRGTLRRAAALGVGLRAGAGGRAGCWVM